ncbi:ATP-binding cassette domain-containing protein [Roseibium salinum]|uniref:ATP-binding cassette domain-containing protein n=1 Tax=Roseibium salinum TaxID=1604349 RepID=A0ABT3R9Q9_9HYPH|nr:ATP-binding cassette domain-containing protein [Roseibium sp. DSM 29163]MCX2725794.1 ATP-binding cassette domain-containing protein [Roseibium sp. DSM 29163]MDN3720435.1 ATP-binding cassette domain-containing protein [Roseibium salinum]
MVLADFIREAEPRQLRAMLGLTLVAGLANASLIIIVTNVAETVSYGLRPSLLHWITFLIAFGLYYFANQIALVRSMEVIEDLLNRKRLGIADKLRKSELLVADSLGRGRLYNLVAKETNHLSVTFPLVVDAIQQMVLLGIALVYLLYLSPAAFVVFLATIGMSALGYKVIDRRFRGILELVERMQAQMLDAIVDILRGAKELRLNAAKSEAVAAAYRKRSDVLERLLVRSVEHWVSLILLGSLSTFLMLGVVAFLFPAYVTGHKTIIFQLIPVLLFCMGTLWKTVAQSPMFIRAEVGLQSILKIDEELSATSSISPDEARLHSKAFLDFSTISFNEIQFSYDRTDPEAYTVGPLNLTVSRGEVVFLVGGNGSGKSTALRMMTGLYPLHSGWIGVDDAAVAGKAVAGYRELFSSVFVDFHLFDRLYGLEDIDPGRVNRLIAEMGLADKVSFEDGKFNQLHLSTGQRKRLALIAAVLEDRPVYIFDEWSAEQDVHFREFFYNSFIPNLRRDGKLVIATSHDEKYWKVADRIVKLDLGRIEWIKSGSEWEDR